MQGAQFAPGWQKDLSPYATRTREAFRHHTHAVLECRECHLPENVEFLTDFDIVTGAGQCARCHDAQQVAEEDYRQIRGMRWFGGAAPIRPPQLKIGGMLSMLPSQNGGFTSFSTSFA